jgi:organic radical activating enzyme
MSLIISEHPEQELIAIEPTEQYRKVLRVEWLLTRKCNFACSYCHEYERGPHGISENVELALDLLRQKAGGQKIALLLTGGEPSLHPEFKKIVQIADQLNMRTQVVTNGSLSPDFYVSCIPNLKDFTFSIHLEMNYEKTLKSLMAVFEAKKFFPSTNILVHLVALPGRMDLVKQIYNDLSEKKIKTVVRRVRPIFDSNGKPKAPKHINDESLYRNTNIQKFDTDFGLYTENEISEMKRLKSTSSINTYSYWIKKDNSIEKTPIIANTMGTYKINRFKDWTCWAGIERLQIDYNGDVYRGTCRVGEKLGNFFSDFYLPKHPVRCTRITCTCAWAMAISKAKNDNGLSQIEYGKEYLEKRYLE